MLADGPFPQNIALPVHFDHSVIQKLFIRYFRVSDRLVYQDQCIAFQRFCIHPGNIVSHRISLSLIVMVLACHPAVIPSRVINIFKMIKFPDNISIVINLDQVDTVLHPVIRMTVP